MYVLKLCSGKKYFHFIYYIKCVCGGKLVCVCVYVRRSAVNIITLHWNNSHNISIGRYVQTFHMNTHMCLYRKMNMHNCTYTYIYALHKTNIKVKSGCMPTTTTTTRPVTDCNTGSWDMRRSRYMYYTYMKKIIDDEAKRKTITLRSSDDRQVI